MTLRIKLPHLATGLVVGALLIGAGYALATTRSAVIHACINTRTRALTVPASGKCARGYRALSWNQHGARGAKGAKGTPGAKGATGPAGASATVSVGSVTTEPAGSQATVTNSGSGGNAILNFGIPQGAAGANATGTAATAYGEVWMGSALNSASLARGSSNVTVGGGDGTAVVDVSGCSTAGLDEPVISVTADDDPSDHEPGSNDSSSHVGAAYVAGWSSAGNVLEVTVTTFNPADGTAANSDFSFTVYC